MTTKRNQSINGTDIASAGQLLDKWAAKNGLEGEPAIQAIQVCDTILANIIESKTHPIIAIHGLLMCVIKSSVYCRMPKEHIRDLIGDNAELLYQYATIEATSTHRVNNADMHGFEAANGEGRAM